MHARLFFLEVSGGGRVLAVNPDGSDRRVIATNCAMPDGIAADVEHGHIYWTNMGNPPVNDGSIERADLDGSNRVTIVPPGGTFTPKQLQLEAVSRKLYWCDREGMRVMRCDLDGSNVETLVQTGQGDDERREVTNWCVGIAVDPDRGQVYWTQKGPSDAGRGKILRAGIELPAGQMAADRGDIEVLFDGLPEPIDLELDLATRTLYWTDRGDPPRGNTVNRAPMDAANGDRPPPDILSTHLMEGIGIALDRAGRRMFMTDLGGSVYRADMDGSRGRELLVAQGNLTGIAYVELSVER
jgi:DNA-binding beta-propeller fold protein YncE